MADYDFLLADEWDSTWDDLASSSPCECPTPPRQFLIPPPPPPPAMGVCGGSPLGDPVGERGGGYFCHLEPMGAEFTQAGFPSLPVIAVCSSIVLVAVLVASFLIWRHKTKVQNLLPCKHDHHQPGHCDLGGNGPNGVTYEDVLINHHPTRLPLTGPPIVGGTTLMPIELLDVKMGDIVPPETGALHPGSFYPCRDSAGRIIAGKPFHPVYEEISREPSAGKSVSKSYDSDIEESGRGGRSFTSEDDFAEDEFSGLEYPSGDGSHRCSATSSVQGSTGGDLCKDPVSSDDAAGEDCEYSPQSIPGLMPPESDFDYPRKQINLRCTPENLNRISNIGELGPVQKAYPSNVASAPVTHSGLPEDCNEQFIIPSLGNFVPDGGGIPQSSRNSNKWSVYPPPLCNVIPRDSLNFPAENIYSTIDEGDMVDSSHMFSAKASTPSRTRPPQGNLPVSSKRNLSPAKKQGTKLKSSGELNKRYHDEESESYGDMLPAYDTTPCIT